MLSVLMSYARKQYVYSKTPLNAAPINAVSVLRGSIGIFLNLTLYWYLLYSVRQIPCFLENALKRLLWIFSQISFFIWKYNPSG